MAEFPRLFTVSEAEALMPQLGVLLKRLQKAAGKARAHYEADLRSVVKTSLTNGHSKPKKRRPIVREIEEIVRAVHLHGAVVKDLEMGLVDFPHQRGNQVVFLCWKLGEPSIRYWHELDRGFAERKPVAQPPNKAMADTVIDAFARRYDKPTHLAWAPGRVNLIGEHTDYNDGYVMPLAINRYLMAAAKVNEEGLLRGFSSIDQNQPSLNQIEHRMNDVPLEAPNDWSKHALGVAKMLSKDGAQLSGLDFAVESSLPIGAGLSSSAAIEAVFALLWNEIDRLERSPTELAKLCQQAERDYVGLNCGIMDQLAVLASREGFAMLIDTRDLSLRFAPIPKSWLIVVADTGTPRELTASAYNERVKACRKAAKALKKKSLRNASLDDLEKLDAELLPLARHVITENDRVLAFAAALQAGDSAQAGALMAESHRSLRDDYKVSSPALDAMAEACWQAPGCIGARMTGAGFGGACVSLVEAAQLHDFIASAEKAYKKAMPHRPSLQVCQSVGSAGIVEL